MVSKQTLALVYAIFIIKIIIYNLWVIYGQICGFVDVENSVTVTKTC